MMDINNHSRPIQRYQQRLHIRIRRSPVCAVCGGGRPGFGRRLDEAGDSPSCRGPITIVLFFALEITYSYHP
ncbi:hypothetical protein Taro_040249 [Colocasia esculenta]|uniref:Uncharacterized protein n=1 Tax=Colocasia esculenta TaxID=4460 RepID=A0A843WCQ0_COLES|nr:hypothetical protein [Colocasia esculenta]